MVIAEVNQTLAYSGRNGMGTPGFGIPPNEVDFGVVLAAVPAMHRLGTTSINASLAPASAITIAAATAPIPRFADVSQAIQAFAIAC